MPNQWTDSDKARWVDTDEMQWRVSIVALAIFITKKATYYFESAGNATDFGDLTVARGTLAATSDG